MLPEKIFGDLHTIMIILVFFEQILSKFCLTILPLILCASLNITHFVRTFSNMRAYKTYCYRRGSKLKRF